MGNNLLLLYFGKYGIGKNESHGYHRRKFINTNTIPKRLAKNVPEGKGSGYKIYKQKLTVPK